MATNKILGMVGPILAPLHARGVMPPALKFKVTAQTSNRLNFVFPPVRASSPALIRVPQAEWLRAENILLPKAGEYSQVPLLTAEEFSGVPEIQLVSDADANDFVPLRKDRATGKIFHGTAHLPTDLVPPESGERGDIRQPGKSPKVSDDLWERVMQALQPPIDFDFKDILELPPHIELRPYQWEGIKKLSENKSFLLGDDMGTGKTVQSILACRLLYQRGDVRRALFVAPRTVIPQWADEFGRWAPPLTVAVVQGDKKSRRLIWGRQAHVWLTTYDILRQDIAVIKDKHYGFDVMVADEAQRIKNPQAKISKVAKQLGALSTRKWALTGTPVENSTKDLESIFDFVKPGLFSPDTDNFGLKPRIPHSEIIAPYFLRRRIEDVIKDLPQKVEIPLWLHLNNEQQSAYDAMERDRVIQMQEREITAFRIITLIGELKKICNRDPIGGGSVKIDWLREKLGDAKESGDAKFLVFSQYRQERCGGRDYISAELAEFGALNYGQGTKADGKVLRDFQNDPEKRVFVGHPKVAGVGLNQLTVANQVVHFDHWWNPAVTNQATARAYRPGQQSDTVIVYHLWVKNTVEEMVLRKTEEKLRLFDEVINRLSNTQISEIAFEVRDELLKKHGFAPVQASSASYTPRGFEEEVCRVFAAMGYNTRLTPQTADGGVDVIAVREVGSSLEKFAIQCKHQQAPVGRPACQQLLGVVFGDTTYSGGILVTTGTASREAKEFVRKDGRIKIINGAEFESLRKKHPSPHPEPKAV